MIKNASTARWLTLESQHSEAEAGGSLQVLGQPGLHSKTLSPSTKPQEHLPTLGYAFWNLQFLMCSQGHLPIPPG